jgi:hypothetical protein
MDDWVVLAQTPSTHAFLTIWLTRRRAFPPFVCEIKDSRPFYLPLLEDGLTGDIKKLASALPEYRLRIGVWRVLFEIVERKIIIYRILHRKEAYR